MPRDRQRAAGRKSGAARLRALLGERLLDNRWLGRLGGISFLGTLDAHPRSRRVSSRLEHSIGVANLAADAAEALGLADDRARLFVAACLFHDIGHYPLSHAAEAAFTERLGANHHAVGRWILLGEGPVAPPRSLRPALEAANIDPVAVWTILDRAESDPELGPLAELLTAPINLDTLEGIRRVARDFRIASRRLPERIFAWVDGELGIDRAAIPAIDRFWRLKHRVYDEVINLPSNILAEARLCDAVASAIDEAVLDDLVEFDDAALRGLLGDGAWAAAALVGHEDDDYELWTSEDYGEVVEGGRTPVRVRVRKRYHVDRSVEPRTGGLPLRDWGLRYRHERRPAWVVARREDQLALPLPQPPSKAPRFTTEATEAPEI